MGIVLSYDLLALESDMLGSSLERKSKAASVHGLSECTTAPRIKRRGCRLAFRRGGPQATALRPRP